MGENYIILDLNTLKLITKWNKTVTFDSYMVAFNYAENKDIQFKLIKL